MIIINFVFDNNSEIKNVIDEKTHFIKNNLGIKYLSIILLVDNYMIIIILLIMLLMVIKIQEYILNNNL